MSKTLALMLAEERLIARWQIEAALQSQLIHEGSLGVNLVRLGYIDEERLRRFQARFTGTPLLKDGFLDGVPDAVTDRLPPDLVFQWRVMPVAVKDGKLVVASSEPLQEQVLHDIALFVGQDVQSVLASERALLDAVLRHYAMRLPSLLFDSPAAAGPEPGARPADAAPAVRQSERIRRAMDTSLSDYDIPSDANIERLLAAFPETRGLVPPEDEKAEALEATRDDDALAEAPLSAEDLPPSFEELAPVSEASAIVDVEREAAAEQTVVPTPASLSLDELECALAGASERDAIVEAALRWLSPAFGLRLFFTVKKSMAAGHMSQGEGLAPESVKEMELALNLVSLLQRAANDGAVFVGEVAHDVALEALFAAAGLWPPQTALVVPVPLKGKCVGLLVALKPASDAPADPAFWQEAQKRLVAAFETLILAKKLGV
ncbi:MAG: hypothetical protein C4523_21530 [Myxococcales bacterium]|nr:MAG: hypothetical protein C4523_21530 [Myxococcales bacterium]